MNHHQLVELAGISLAGNAALIAHGLLRSRTIRDIGRRLAGGHRSQKLKPSKDHEISPVQLVDVDGRTVGRLPPPPSFVDVIDERSTVAHTLVDRLQPPRKAHP